MSFYVYTGLSGKSSRLLRKIKTYATNLFYGSLLSEIHGPMMVSILNKKHSVSVNGTLKFEIRNLPSCRRISNFQFQVVNGYKILVIPARFQA